MPTLQNPSPREARTAVGDLLAPVADPAVASDVQLVTSELVANAVQHGVPPVAVRVEVEGTSVVVEVHDRGAGPRHGATRRRPGPGRRGGYGLHIVERIADHLELGRVGGGFTARCTFDLGTGASP